MVELEGRPCATGQSRVPPADRVFTRQQGRGRRATLHVVGTGRGRQASPQDGVVVGTVEASRARRVARRGVPMRSALGSLPSPRFPRRCNALDRHAGLRPAQVRPDGAHAPSRGDHTRSATSAADGVSTMPPATRMSSSFAMRSKYRVSSTVAIIGAITRHPGGRIPSLTPTHRIPAPRGSPPARTSPWTQLPCPLPPMRTEMDVRARRARSGVVRPAAATSALGCGYLIAQASMSPKLRCTRDLTAGVARETCAAISDRTHPSRQGQ